MTHLQGHPQQCREKAGACPCLFSAAVARWLRLVLSLEQWGFCFVQCLLSTSSENFRSHHHMVKGITGSMPEGGKEGEKVEGRERESWFL